MPASSQSDRTLEEKNTALVKNSPLEGLRGTLGDFVFRTWGGKTFVHPKPQNPAQQTTAQKANRIGFSQANAG